MKDMQIDIKEGKDLPVQKSLVREIFDWVACLLVAFTVAILIRYFVFTPTLVRQTSMTPTIRDGERVLINRLVRTFNLPLYRGDIITFEKPVRSVDGLGVYDERHGVWDVFLHDVIEVTKVSFIKRIIGLPGDHVAIKDGAVYVNDQKLSEVYLNGIETPITGDYYDVEVPEGYLFVMGDNRSGSSDSREFGCIPIGKVEGRVKYRIWPIAKFGKIDK